MEKIVLMEPHLPLYLVDAWKALAISGSISMAKPYFCISLSLRSLTFSETQSVNMLFSTVAQTFPIHCFGSLGISRPIGR